MFDFGFTHFITNTWISFIWILNVILTILSCVVATYIGLYALNYGGSAGFLLLSPIVAALFLLFTRMGLECIIVLFRIETHLRVIREKSETK